MLVKGATGPYLAHPGVWDMDMVVMDSAPGGQATINSVGTKQNLVNSHGTTTVHHQENPNIWYSFGSWQQPQVVFAMWYPNFQ